MPNRYGPRRPCDPEQQVFVERKTHRAAWTRESSIKVGVATPHGVSVHARIQDPVHLACA